MQLSKMDFVKKVALRCNTTQKDATTAVDAVIDELRECMKQGDSVQFSQFGVIGTKDRAARKARNVHTGEELIVPAKRVPFFKPSSKLTESINNKEN